MYEPHFGLREAPFAITPDTEFLYRSVAAQEALNTVLVALRSGEGFVKVTGEVGTGKTLLCRTLLRRLGPDFETAYIPVPSPSALGLLLDVADELDVDTSVLAAVPEFERTHQLLKLLLDRLVREARAGRKVLVCLDEAQALPIEALEALRLLTNLETEKRKLVQVLIIGQPELDAKMAHHSIRQLRQRITFQHTLQPMSLAELREYLQHRMNVAGWRGGTVFGPGAVALLLAASRGTPRLVNILAHKSLMAAFGRGRRTVGWREMAAALADNRGWWPRPPVGALAGLGAFAVAAVLVQWTRAMP